ncbi:MAG: phosphatase PAP2 family protein [Pirellulales bacterium]
MNHSSENRQDLPLVEASFGWNLRIFFLLILVGVLCFSIDIGISSNFVGEDSAKYKLPGELRTLISLSEIFAHGTGVILISLAVLALDRRNWKLSLVPISAALSAGVFANVVKFIGISRIRPREFDMDLTVSDSFQNIIPLFNSGGWDRALEYLGQSNLHSFPSAHAATAAGLWVGLSALYPQGRWYFAVLALLSGLQRIVSGAHFPSDVCFGYAAGFLFATLLLRTRISQSILKLAKASE